MTDFLTTGAGVSAGASSLFCASSGIDVIPVGSQNRTHCLNTPSPTDTLCKQKRMHRFSVGSGRRWAITSLPPLGSHRLLLEALTTSEHDRFSAQPSSHRSS